jgi:putative acetyltransferase
LTITSPPRGLKTAPGSAHALDLQGLRSPDITFWTAWDGDSLIAMGR